MRLSIPACRPQIDLEITFPIFRPHASTPLVRLGFLTLTLALLAVAPHPAGAAPSTRVLIVSGLAGDQKESDRFQALQERYAAAFAARGIPAANIETAPNVTADAFKARLAALVPKLTAADSFWLILLGHCEPRMDGPVFQVSGPRVHAADFKSALAGITARQYLILTPESTGGYIALLAAPNRIILTATEPSGELNETYFPDAFAAALEDAHNSSLLKLARVTARLVHDFYDHGGLAQTEHAMLSDPSQPQPILEPFDSTSGTLLADQPALPVETPTSVSADQPALPEPPPAAPPKPGVPSSSTHQPATAETLALIKQARAAPDDGSPAVILEKDLNCLVNADESQVITAHQIIAIRKASGANWGDLEFSSTPPLNEVTVEKARTIFPDGTWIEAGTDARSEMESGDYLAEKKIAVRLPAVTAGCILDYTVRNEQAPNEQVSGVYQEIPVTESLPILACDLTLRLPNNDSIHYLLRNLPGSPTVENGAYSQTLHWSWKNLPACEHLPYDPPLRDVQGMVLLSSYKSWSEFADWFHRIAAGSDTAGPAVQARAAADTAGLKTDRDKLHALFDDVSRIHYAAIEIGVGAFRPHTPDEVLATNYGDCKDKANLLIALAKQVGIDGEFVLLNRTSSTDRSFPGFQFNHALAFFPNVDGGLWLDTTDEITAFGQLPPGDVGRDGLVMNGPQSPRFAVVPVPPAQATQLREHLVLDPTGATPCQITLATQGLTDYTLRSALRTLTGRQTDLFLRQHLGDLLPGATLRSYTVSDLDRLDQPVRVTCTFDLLPGAGAAIVRQTRLPLELLEAIATPTRTLPLVLNDGQPFFLEQTVDLAGGSTAPATKSDLVAPGATGSVAVSTQGHALTRVLQINVTQPTVPAADYPAFRTFVQQLELRVLNTPTP
jgi:hypothetical protein